MAAQVGQLIGERYRLEQRLSSAPPGEAPQGELWRASDQLVAEAPMALRLLGPGIDPERARQRWGRLQGVLHPQVPRLGAVIPAAEGLWLVREWQAGRTYQQLLAARAERQLVFGAGEVLLLLRQLLPVLAVLHSQELVHGDLSPANLLRRDSDGLPVLLDFGLVAGTPAATPGYAPPERARAAEPEPWMDLHALGAVALVLLSGDEPARLLDPVTLAWRWPASLSAEPALQAQIARLLEREPGERFASASQALAAFQTLPMPESTGPVARADRTVALVPPPVAAALPVPEPPPAPEPELPTAPEPAAPESAAPQPELPPLSPPPPLTPPPPAVLRSRLEEREEAAEGGIWPVVIALVLSAVVGTALGWWWLSRGRLALPTPDAALQLPSSLPPAEVDQRQQLLNRLRAMQVDRGWFLKLVDASLLAQFPERGGRLPSDSLEDAPLRKVWNELAEEWLARVEQLPLEIRRRLGSYTNGDWERRQQALVSQGLSPAVLRQLVSGSAQSLLPGRPGADIPAEPFRQLWFAAAEQSLANVQIEAIQAQPQETRVLSAQVEAGGARLFPVRLPPGYRLVLGVNGSPLMQMSVFGPDGDLLEAKGPLRVVSLGVQKRSPVQLLVTNDGVAPALITLSLRADPPAEAPQASPQPPRAPAQLEAPQAPTVPVPAAPATPIQPLAAPPPPAPPPVN
ncbi:phosphotransferase [Cyanobium sp. Aljojuca 7D2]|uniref:serine/threonine protein kinase n=1 Tax=Cyanobium sp. Aljojuca 7D2 TaxID=2823698 RepID=UPI0021BC5206|nr:phosphotransferase [Cyanobium sp. Aljojuca 7D2]MCP9890726.1 phosphotransferase [Cyanobium sp. Aljojuca 7D2]